MVGVPILWNTKHGVYKKVNMNEDTSMKITATAIPIRIATLWVRNDLRLSSQPYADITQYTIKLLALTFKVRQCLHWIIYIH